MRLSELQTGERGIIVRHYGDKSFGRRLREMGFLPGEEILVVKNAPLKDPVEYRVLGYDLALRRSEAAEIEVDPLTEPAVQDFGDTAPNEVYAAQKEVIIPERGKDERSIRVAFVGNPNCGKTSLFNSASGSNEHVGNYSGVTVEEKTATYKLDGYTFHLTDLPGTYSLSSYSPEEKFVSQHLMGEKRPDVIVNVVDSSNLERNFYLTTQLMEMSVPMVVALNMYDELEESGSRLDIAKLSELTGLPMVPTVGRSGEGVEELFRQVIKLSQNTSTSRRVIDVSYGTEVESAITELLSELRRDAEISVTWLRPRFVAIKLLEDDEALSDFVLKYHPEGEELLRKAEEIRVGFEKETGRNLGDELTNGRYGFVRGALQETYQADYTKITEKNRKIDHILTHRIWGFPIFILIMFLTFQLTFKLGEYPMAWIEAGMEWLGAQVGALMGEGSLRDLLVDGIISGVGGVLVFLPNIVILYLCIAIMEDTGYLARAAFIMDRLMHGIGLHGKSFIPLLMGFGCSVPAIMATRTIENRNNRLLTMLIIPFMSCSAKLPVYLLLAGTFFPRNAGTVLFFIYFAGVLVAIGSALVLKKLIYTHKETPFVMELPPYRVPTGRSVLLQMWFKARQYLEKMGTVILVASVIIWALEYFPQVPGLDESGGAEIYEDFLAEKSEQEVANFQELSPEHQQNMVQQEYSYIGRLGKTVEPIFEPLGYDWKMSVALLTGIATKEVVVSTLGVLYTGDAESEVSFPEKLESATHANGSKVFTPEVALSYMIFVLVYFPCIAAMVAIGRESGSWKWAVFSFFYTLLLAWVLGWLVTWVGGMIW